MNTHYKLIIILVLLMAVMIMRYTSDTFAAERLRAPDFPRGASWINTERPLTMKELRGRAVLLDFWTYCCINCMHVLPDLARLEDKFGDRLVVVGVHSAKFEGEKDTENIRDAVRRYDIRHPVVNDAGFVMWQELGIRAWPTLVLIDTDGYIVGQVSGEGNFDVLDKAIGEILSGSGKQTDLPSLPISVESGDDNTNILDYPGKIIVDSDGSRLFVADSGNHRILVIDKDSGDISETIGSGTAGLRNGGYSEAAFSNPQGMALVGDILYVADTDNHALRAVALDSRTVRTISGDGRQARWRASGGTAGSTRLNSPWDLEYLDGILYIAMAGPHQLWYYDPASNKIGVYAGSGREDIVDSSFENAALAQPSGITTDGVDLYFADSETSSIRKADAAAKRIVTLTGTGLFDFGHRDGSLKTARLQHPLGVAWGDGALWIADTYNNRIRKIDPAASLISTIAGGAEDGLVDGVGLSARFDEPGGIAYSKGKLYVADTNNHAIRIVDTAAGSVSTLTINSVVKISKNDSEFRVRITAPEGFHISGEAPNEIRAELKGDGSQLETARTVLETGTIEAFFPVQEITEEASVSISGDIYLCGEGDNTICYPKSFAVSKLIRRGEITGESDIVSLTVDAPLLSN